MTPTSDNKRVAKNTLILYFRMLFMMLIGLYTSRINLQSLGVEDYGIYNVVGGVVAMFYIVNGSITASIGRFLTFELGTGNIEKLKKVFSTSLTIQIGISLIIVFLAETIGLWFLNNKIVIPQARIYAANWVYQFSILTFIQGMISMPYNASIVAHEKMSAFAWITIFDAIAKLLLAWLTFIAPMDKLIFYGAFIVLIAFTQQMIYTIYCVRNFEECKYKFTIDKELFKNMFGFAGWNFIGASSAILRDAGGNIVINLFNGPTVNAARAIAGSINNAVLGFANSFMTAINPQITKAYASKDHEKMMGLIYKGAKFSFFLLLILGLPVIMNTEYLINLWLGQVPDHTVLFVQLTIFYAMGESISNPLITAMLATGKIRNYQIIVGGLQMLNLPISYICLRNGCIPETVVIVAIIISQFCFAARICMLKSMINLKIRSYLRYIYFRIILTLIIAAIIPFIVKNCLDKSFLDFLITALISFCSACLSILYIGCNRNERYYIYSNIHQFKDKLSRK